MAFSAVKFPRTNMLALVLVGVFSVGVVGGAVVAPDASAEKKKCKKGYERVGNKCKRKPFEITPSSITLVAGALKKGRFGATGYAYFPATTRRSVLRGYWHISNGIGFERLKVEWEVGKNANYSNFTDMNRKVGLTGENMTAVLVVKGVRSNTQVLKQQ